MSKNLEKTINNILKKYRAIVIDRLYKLDGYSFEDLLHVDDGYNEYIFIIYKRRVKE